MENRVYRRLDEDIKEKGNNFFVKTAGKINQKTVQIKQKNPHLFFHKKFKTHAL